MDRSGRSWGGRTLVGVLLLETFSNHSVELGVLVGDLLGGLDCSLAEPTELVQLGSFCAEDGHVHQKL